MLDLVINLVSINNAPEKDVTASVQSFFFGCFLILCYKSRYNKFKLIKNFFIKNDWVYKIPDQYDDSRMLNALSKLFSSTRIKVITLNFTKLLHQIGRCWL